MKNLDDYRDSQNFIIHLPDDSGDATQRTFAEVVLRFGGPRHIPVREVRKRLDLIYSRDRMEFRRYWKTSHWGGKWGTMSRDNFTSIWLTLILYNLVEEYPLPKERFGFLTNYKDLGKDRFTNVIPDHIGPANLGFKYRGAFLKILGISDIPVLIQATIQVLISWTWEKPGRWKTSNDLNLRLHLDARNAMGHSWASRLADLIYYLRRPAGDDHKRFEHLNGPDSAWHSYFRWRSAPPMYSLLR